LLLPPKTSDNPAKKSDPKPVPVTILAETIPKFYTIFTLAISFVVVTVNFITFPFT